MIFIYLALTFLLSIYSFSQVDLNLNLSKNVNYLSFENQMKYLGFYERNSSFWIFFSLSLVLIILYGVIILKDKLKTVSYPRNFYLLFFIFYLISYPAFLSYDIFNYFFDARIVVKYHENPYFFPAQRYVFDEWLRFMRWTHRVYPYGPIWLLLAIIPIFLGFGKLVPTIFFFKIFNLLVFLGCVKLIKKISSEKNNWLLFALHPIVIYDFLISMHNEGLMLFFLLASIYFFQKDKKKSVVIFLLLSAGVKFITIVFLPIYLLLWFRPLRGNPDSNRILINNSSLISLISLIPLIVLREGYSWYFIIPVALLVLNLTKLNRVILIFLSFLIFRYAPFILIGEYNRTVIFWQNSISYVTVGLSTVIIVGEFFLKRIYFKKC